MGWKWYKQKEGSSWCKRTSNKSVGKYNGSQSTSNNSERPVKFESEYARLYTVTYLA